MKNIAFFGGVPVAPDVERLEKAFKLEEMLPGKKISYKEVAEVLGLEIKSTRFKTVTGAWRKKLFKNSIILDPNREGEFVVLNDSQKVDKRRSKHKTARRSIITSFRISATVDVSNLDPEKKKEHEFLNLREASLLTYENSKSKEKLLPEI